MYMGRSVDVQHRFPTKIFEQAKRLESGGDD
jgi:hypothetical protein